MSDEQLLIGFDLSTASIGVLEVLCDESADESLFNDIYRANIARPEVLKLLYDHYETPQVLLDEIAPVLQLPMKKQGEGRPAPKKAETEEPKEERQVREKKEEEQEQEARLMKSENLLTKIAKLSTGEKVQLAMKGGKEVRSILLKDTSKEVVKKVMENPKMTDSEVDLISRNRQVPEDVLRMIAKKKEWMKNYSIMLGLVTNPKTPPGVAMPFVKNVKKKDLAMLEKNKNISQAVRAAAKKFLSAKTPGS
ncbi:MAG: hypothetical protein JSV21_08200 [Nitrospirota bacterium]|nr:MAG: hypothetical protein JSV21_08200 [Nitrospirota bacterium]